MPGYFWLPISMIHDPKVQLLHPELFKFWVNSLCLANMHPLHVIPSIDDVVEELGIRRDHAERFMDELLAKGLYSRDESGSFLPNPSYFRRGPFGSIFDRPAPKVWNAIRSFVFDRDDFTCQYCGTRGGRLECDHKIPVSRGGSHEYGNLATACFKCNRSKQAKTPEEWLR